MLFFLILNTLKDWITSALLHIFIFPLFHLLLSKLEMDLQLERPNASPLDHSKLVELSDSWNSLCFWLAISLKWEFLSQILTLQDLFFSKSNKMKYFCFCLRLRLCYWVASVSIRCGPLTQCYQMILCVFVISIFKITSIECELTELQYSNAVVNLQKSKYSPQLTSLNNSIKSLFPLCTFLLDFVLDFG